MHDKKMRFIRVSNRTQTKRRGKYLIKYLNLKNKSPLKSSDYTFIRGDDVKCTKIYKINYLVKFV